MRRTLHWVPLTLLLAAAGCARFGFSGRVLHDVPSPDGRFIAICQEVPAFDGPDFDIRLHRPDGSLVQRLLVLGDGDSCDEVVWSKKGATLAVLSRHVARAKVVDVEGALRAPVDRELWPRTVNLTWPEGAARNLVFVQPGLFEFDACDAIDAGRNRDCRVNYVRRRLAF